jgi:hypothetical protein
MLGTSPETLTTIHLALSTGEFLQRRNVLIIYYLYPSLAELAASNLSVRIKLSHNVVPL